MNSKKVLYISYDGMTDPLGQAQVLPYLKGLSKKGHDLTILSFEKKEAYINNKSKISEILEEDDIDWIPLRYHSKPPVLATLFDVLAMWGSAKKLQQQNNYSIVHCRSYISALIGLKLKKKFNVKFVFDMRGFWADERIDGNIWNLKNPVFKMIYDYFKRKEIDFLNHSDAVISLTHNAKKEILSWKEITSNKKIKVIPCCVDTELFCNSGDSVEDLKLELGINQHTFVFTYLGSIGTWYMLDEMLSFFKILKKKKLNAKFLFLTNDDPLFIMESAARLRIENSDIIVKSVQRDMVPRYLQITKLAIFFILPAFSKKASSPTKMGELLSMNIPIICNSGIGDVDSVIKDNNLGVIVNEFTDEAYGKAIETYESLEFFKLREIAISNFSLSKGISIYNQVYKSL